MTMFMNNITREHKMLGMTKFIKKSRICNLIAAAGLLLGAHSAMAEVAYPTKAVKIIVPFPPGGTTDAFARFVGEQLQAKWGQAVIVENRPGAMGSVGTEALKKAPADGYTILLGASYLTIAPSLFSTLPYDARKDLLPTGVGVSYPLVLYASASMGVKTYAEALAKLKAEPDAYNVASAGNGTLAHIAGELFQRDAGVKMVHIPYQGTAPALLDVIAGRAQLIFEAASAGKGYLKTGQLVPLLRSSSAPITGFEAIPSAASVGLPALDIAPWNVFFLRSGTDPALAAKISSDLSAVVSSPATTTLLSEQSNEAVLSNTVDFSARMERELKQMSDIIKSANIKAN
jgi:tripartite-type tricarboxylate transporter receptor subunit TctC